MVGDQSSSLLLYIVVFHYSQLRVGVMPYEFSRIQLLPTSAIHQREGIRGVWKPIRETWSNEKDGLVGVGIASIDTDYLCSSIATVRRFSTFWLVSGSVVSPALTAQTIGTVCHEQ